MVEDIAPRILRQHSIFVFGHPILAEDSVYSVKIAGHAKQGILEELELQHGLSSESLFQDIFGFSSANNHISGLKIVETSVDYFRRGTQAYNQDNYETAILDFTEAVYLRPASAELFVGRAHARASLAQSRGDNLDYGTAIDDYDRAVGLVAQVPQGKEMIVHAMALHNRGNVRVLMKDYEGAIRDYSECIKLEKDVDLSGGNPYYNRGNTYCRIERWDEAVIDYQEAISRGQQVRDSHYNLANVYVIVEQYESALQHYDQAIAVDSQFRNTLINRATTRALSGDIETAMQEYAEHGGLVNNEALVAQALAGDEPTGSLTVIGNTGNTGNVGLQGIGGPKGGKGFPGGGAFGKRFDYPTQ